MLDTSINLVGLESLVVAEFECVRQWSCVLLHLSIQDLINTAVSLGVGCLEVCIGRCGAVRGSIGDISPECPQCAELKLHYPGVLESRILADQNLYQIKNHLSFLYTV